MKVVKAIEQTQYVYLYVVIVDVLLISTGIALFCIKNHRQKKLEVRADFIDHVHRLLSLDPVCVAKIVDVPLLHCIQQFS